MREDVYGEDVRERAQSIAVKSGLSAIVNSIGTGVLQAAGGRIRAGTEIPESRSVPTDPGYDPIPDERKEMHADHHRR